MTKKTISITSRLTYNGGTKKRHESPNGESMTMENETMSIQDIIRRQAAGLVDIDKKGLYLDSEIEAIDKFHGQPLDLTDMDELKAKNKAFAKAIDDKEKELLARKEQEELDAKLDARMAQREKEKSEAKSTKNEKHESDK